MTNKSVSLRVIVKHEGKECPFGRRRNSLASGGRRQMADALHRLQRIYTDRFKYYLIGIKSNTTLTRWNKIDIEHRMIGTNRIEYPIKIMMVSRTSFFYAHKIRFLVCQRCLLKILLAIKKKIVDSIDSIKPVACTGLCLSIQKCTAMYQCVDDNVIKLVKCKSHLCCATCAHVASQLFHLIA